MKKNLDKPPKLLSSLNFLELLGETVKKSLVLNCLELTPKKQNILNKFFKEYRRVLNLTLLQLPLACSSTDLHHLTYLDIRKTSFLPSDIIE